MIHRTSPDKEKIERVKILLRNFGTNLLDLEECHRWNSPVNMKNLPGLQSEQKKIAAEIRQIAANFREADVLDSTIKTFSKEISNNVEGNINDEYYYRIWIDILKDDIVKYI